METIDILSEIVANKRFEVDIQKHSVSPEQLEDSITDTASHRSVRKALADPGTGIIAEFKRRSPSKGWIKKDAEISSIIPAYEKAGASALSILTDEKFFGGTLSDLRNARPLTDLPIIRKDFIIDEYQLYQAKIVGADAVLLIAATLRPDECTALTAKAHAIGLEILLEIHCESELSYITPDIDMVGINNRDLGTFHTSVDNSFRLAGLLPQDAVLVSESGISCPQTITKLRSAGFRGFLIGETFMKTAEPGDTLESFIRGIGSR